MAERFSSTTEALVPREVKLEEQDISLEVLEPSDNILSLPDQQERPPSPSSSLRSVGSGGSQDEMVISPTSSLIRHQAEVTEHPNVSTQHEFVVNNLTQPGALPEIVISTSDTAHPEEAQGPEVTTNTIDDESSSELVVTPSINKTCLDERHENLDVRQNEEVMEVSRTVNDSSSSQDTMSTNDVSRTQPQSASPLSLKAECTVCTCTCTSRTRTKSTLSTGSTILHEEDIDNSKYNTEAAPIACTQDTCMY